MLHKLSAIFTIVIVRIKLCYVVVHKYNCQDYILEIILNFGQLFAQSLHGTDSWNEALCEACRLESATQWINGSWAKSGLPLGSVGKGSVETQSSVFACCCYNSRDTCHNRDSAAHKAQNTCYLAFSEKVCQSLE